MASAIPSRTDRAGCTFGARPQQGAASVVADEKFESDAEASQELKPIVAQKAAKALEQTRSLGVKIGTYNILCPPHNGCGKRGKARLGDSDSPFQYELHKDGRFYENTDGRLVKTIGNLRRADLDIVCLQETTKETHAVVRETVTRTDKRYASTGCEPHKEGHGVAILYNKDRFRALKCKVFKNTFMIIQKKGSVKEDQRTAVMLDLLDTTTNKVIRVVSAHFFDPNSLASKKRDEYAKWLVGEVTNEPHPEYALDKIVIAGDMNQDQHGDRASADYRDQVSLQSKGRGNPLRAAAFTPFMDNSFHCDENLGGTEFIKKFNSEQLVNKMRKIDWIWVQGGKPENIRIENADLTASDHKMAASEI